jgi:hypothetical protein
MINNEVYLPGNSDRPRIHRESHPGRIYIIRQARGLTGYAGLSDIRTKISFVLIDANQREISTHQR